MRGKRSYRKQIGQKEEIYKSIPAQAENGHLDENQKFAEMVEEEARKKGIPEDRIPDFVTDFQIYSSAERPYIESNYNLSHREIFDELAEEYLAPEEEKEPSQPKAAIPGFEPPKEEAPKAIPATSEKDKALPAIVAVKEVEAAAAEAANSPANALPEPTEPQKEAGNYRKGHLSASRPGHLYRKPQGVRTVRSKPRKGRNGRMPLPITTVYIRGTKGKDKDHLDAFVGPYPDSEFVTVIDQVDPKTGKFDEHKVMIGFQDMASAQVGYLCQL